MGERWEYFCGWCERWYPLTIGVGAACVYGLLVQGYHLPKTMNALVGGVLNVSSIAVGFLGTTASILLAMQSNRTVRMLREARKYPLLLKFLFSGIWWTLALAVLSGLLLLIDFEQGAPWHEWPVGIWVFVLTVAGLSAFRFVMYFAHILHTL